MKSRKKGVIALVVVFGFFGIIFAIGAGIEYGQNLALEQEIIDNYIISDGVAIPKKCGMFAGFPEQLQTCLKNVYP